MIYSIGHKKNYLATLKEYGVLIKCEGGYAFRTKADAEKRIRECRKIGEWAVFGLKANWKKDTKKDKDGWWHLLKKNAPLVVLK